MVLSNMFKCKYLYSELNSKNDKIKIFYDIYNEDIEDPNKISRKNS